MRKTILVCCSLALMVGACGDDETSEPTPSQDINADAMVTDLSDPEPDTADPGDIAVEETVDPSDVTEISVGDLSSEDVGQSDDAGDAASPEDAMLDSGSWDAQETDVSDDIGGGEEDTTQDTTQDTAQDIAQDIAGDIPGDIPEDAPEGLPEWACTAEQQCSGPDEICFGPEDNFCGMCKDPDFPCTNDGECGGATVCSEEAPACSCTGETECIDPCTPGDECAVGKVCDAGGHCKPKSCADDPSACPANFSCITQGPVDMQLPGTCERTACSQSSECDDHCVKGKCHGIPGNCSPPPP